MSAAAPLRRTAAVRAPSRAVPATAAPRARPRLVLVSPHRTTAGRLPFLILIGAVMVSGLVAVLLLHMMAAQYSFRATAMQTKLSNLKEQKQALLTTIDHDSSPSALAAKAKALGMLPTTTSAFHRLSDGRTIGVQTPIIPPPPVVAAKKPATTTKTTKSAKAGSTSKTGVATKAGATATTGTTTKHGKAGTTGNAGTTGKAGTTGAAGKTGTTGTTSTTTKSGKPTTSTGTTH